MSDAVIRDLGYGLRSLRRAPGVSLLVVLCLGTGIGANTAVWSWIEGILLRPYPAVAHQDRMMAMIQTVPGSGFDDLSWPDFVELRSESRLVQSFLADKIMGVTLSLGDHAERATGSVVSASYFDALGVRPFLGRGFRPDEERVHDPRPLTVISYAAWKERYGGDRSILGRVQRLNGIDHVIVGVAPPDFLGTFVGYRVDYWVPASMAEAFAAGSPKLDDRGSRWIEGFVLLRPGVTRAQGQQELSAIAARIAQRYPDVDRGRGVQLFPLWQTPFNKAGEMRPTLELSLAAVAFVLAIACANVGNLLAVRALARRRELALRLALGSGRRRLAGLLLAEASLLAVVAAAFGVAVAYGCRDLMKAFYPVAKGAGLNLGGALDGRVLAVTVLLAMLAVVLAAVLPAVRGTRVEPAAVLTAEATAVVGSRRGGRLRTALVLVQISLGFALLVATSLLAKSVTSMLEANPGFSTAVLTTPLGLQGADYDDVRARAFQDALLLRVRGLPGVESAAYARVSPFTFVPFSTAAIEVGGYRPPPEEQPTVEYVEVSPGYLATMGIPLREGREVGAGDGKDDAPVAVINEAMAARFFAGRDPLGETFVARGRRLRVVGIAATTKYESLLEAPKPFFYVPLSQANARTVSLLVRTTRGRASLGAALLREIHALDPTLPAYELITLREQVDRMAAPQRAAATLLGIFGALALLLAAVGLYGVMAHAVSQERRGLGLRMALGATGGRVLRLVLARGLALTGLGILVGAVLSLATSRLLAHLLYGVTASDPLAFVTAIGVMLAVAAVACGLPAWRAMRTDPARTLRS